MCLFDSYLVKNWKKCECPPQKPNQWPLDYNEWSTTQSYKRPIGAKPEKKKAIFHKQETSPFFEAAKGLDSKV